MEKPDQGEPGRGSVSCGRRWERGGVSGGEVLSCGRGDGSSAAIKEDVSRCIAPIMVPTNWKKIDAWPSVRFRKQSTVLGSSDV
jgi:hypothetical protein